MPLLEPVTAAHVLIHSVFYRFINGIKPCRNGIVGTIQLNLMII